MKNSLIDDYNKLDMEDKTEAQNRDFNFFREELEQRIQGLYDRVALGIGSKNENLDVDEYTPTIDEAAILDLIYVNLQMIIEYGEQLLKDKC